MAIRPEERGGPYLSAAFLCEKALIEQDGVKSAIRIVDRWTIRGPEPVMQPSDINLTIYIRFKSGWSRGAMRLRVDLITPGPEPVQTILQQQVLFEGEEDRGIDLIAPTRLVVDTPGIYWFNVYLRDELATRMPFRVIYEPRGRR
jgi:hypothetical protein